MGKITLESNLVSVHWLKNHIGSSHLIVLDASIKPIDQKVFSDGSKKIPTALFFDIKNRFSNTDAQFPNTLPSEIQFETQAQNIGINKESVIIVYDEKGIYSSARAWWLLKSFGHRNVAVLDGGLPEWLLKKCPVDSDYGKIRAKGNFKAYYNSKAFIDFKSLQHFILKNNSSIIIDARSSERFNSEVPEPRKGLRRGSIPGSINLPFINLLEEGKFKSEKALKLIFSSIASKKDQLVFSCGSGITACILVLGATLSGYAKVTVYDGSWTEYGTLIKSP